MHDEKGFAVIFVVIGAVLLVIALVIGGNFISKSPNNQGTGQSTTSSGNFQGQPHGSESAGGESLKVYSQNAVFSNEGGVVIEHYFPGENHLSTEESEAYVYNESNSPVVFTTTIINYLLNGVSQNSSSGTWELFPTASSWEKIQYTNIGEQNYDGTPLVVEPGQKAKIHFHYNVEGTNHESGSSRESQSSIKGNQSVSILLVFTQDNETKTIEQTLEK